MNDSITIIQSSEQEESDPSEKRSRNLRTAKYLVSGVLALSGLFILGSQLLPIAQSYLKSVLMEVQSSTIKNPTPEAEIDPQTQDLPYYDPGLSYFQNLIQHISPDYVAGVSTGPNNSGNTANVKIDKTYSKQMKLSIPKLGIQNINVTPNVNSTDDKIYNKALKKGLAHFVGTPLPGDGGNAFIYGHSAVESFFSHHENDPETIFSKLEDIEIADEIIIEKDGKILKYTVEKKKIIDPNDFSILNGLPAKETITLMTCSPNGIGKKRLIVIAELTNG